ncbi:extracellular solute-binding protein [Paenibacillus profundus]|uniref:Extracellular solute-binding protein n=1 Tax=Paenibacillus profundus TaxID=1173085 RepID=A0ABS8YCM1_9BACL|nr:extracellular solute-binding protein [Paenibacillus profundus]MCE5168188.1 extracellular solute-binding protein [Paenibacillus profundus]
MKKSSARIRKWTAIVMAGCLLALALAGCAKEGGKSGADMAQKGGDPPDKKIFTMLIDSNPTFPYKKDWPIWKWIEEKTGVSLRVQLPSGKLADTLNLVIASNNLPDLMFMTDRRTANKYGQQGALANILDYTDDMPNFKKWMEKYPEMVRQALSADGKLFMFPNEGFGETNRMIWMYREDVFAKHGLKPPATFDELYEAAKQLKTLYPDSYPFSFRFGEELGIFVNLAENFETGGDIYYHFGSKEWEYGPIQDNYKKLVEAMHRMYKDGLIPPDWLSIQTKQWQDIVSTNKAFITVDYISRIDFFNIPLRKDDPSFNLAFMEPPAGWAGAKQFNPYLHTLETGLTVASTSSHITDVMKYMDFFYSEEARVIASWGKEGETFTTEGGTRKFKADFADAVDLRSKTGIATNGAYTWIDYDSQLALASEDLQKAYEQARKFDAKLQPKPAFNEQETEVLALTGEAVKKHRSENIAKFILGTRPLSDWDQYVKEAENLGLQKLLDIYKQAYARAAELQLK